METQDGIEQQENPNFFSLKIFNLSKEMEILLQDKLLDILGLYNKAHLQAVVYTILKELAINACKANQKRVFFDERGYNIKDPEQYKVGLKEYKKSFSDDMAIEYGEKSRKMGYYCLITFDHSTNGMTMKVENNTPILKQEELSIREKLGKAVQYDDLALFYMDNADNSEGAGLGLALTIIMLKGEGIDPKYFRIITSSELTLARLEIPFTADFISKRNLKT